MHELSIALNILDIASEESDRYGGARVEAIYIKLGPLSGVVREALSSAFELAREQSSMPEVQLVIEDVPVMVFCADCQANQPAESMQRMCCARCGRPSATIVSGREMEVVAMEIVEPNAAGQPSVVNREV